MRKFKCVSVANENKKYLTIGKIYETDNNGLNYRTDDGFLMIMYPIYTISDGVFEEIFDKSLEDYTLKEVKEYCQYEKVKDANSDYCEECKFNVVCGMCADIWSLKEDKIKLTDSEIEILKAIKTLYPKCDTIFYSNELEMFTNNDKGYGLIQLNTNRLPSLLHNVTYSISELLEGVD